MKALYLLELTAMKNGAYSRNLNVKIPKERDAYAMRCLVNAVVYHVTTGRASLEWKKALAKADPQKLLAYAVKYGPASDVEYIKRITSYLHRYCRLSMHLVCN